MPVTPTGVLSKPLDLLRETIAASSTFQAWVGAANATEAKARIHPVSVSSPTLPCAVLDWSPGWRRSMVAGGSRSFFEQSAGELQLLLRADVDADDSDADAAYTFLNQAGGVLVDVEQLAGQAGYLDVRGITLAQGPHRPEEDEAKSSGDFYQAVFQVEFGGA